MLSKLLKKKHGADFSVLINKIVVETEPRVDNLKSIITTLENTAKVRGIAGFAAEPESKKQGSKRARAAQPVSADPAATDAEASSARRGRRA